MNIAILSSKSMDPIARQVYEQLAANDTLRREGNTYEYIGFESLIFANGEIRPKVLDNLRSKLVTSSTARRSLTPIAGSWSSS